MPPSANPRLLLHRCSRAIRTGAGALTPAQRLAEARWQLPTVSECSASSPIRPCRPLLRSRAEGRVERVDQERYALKQALEEFGELLSRRYMSSALRRPRNSGRLA